MPTTSVSMGNVGVEQLMFLKLKKEKKLFFAVFYGLFLTNRTASTSPTMAIARLFIAIIAAKYWSAIDDTVVGTGLLQ